MTDTEIPLAWIATPTEKEIRARTAAGARNPYDFGFVPAMRRLLMAHGRLGPAFTELFKAVMFEPGALSRAEREMVAAVAAAAQDCHY